MSDNSWLWLFRPYRALAQISLPTQGVALGYFVAHFQCCAERNFKSASKVSLACAAGS